MTKKSVGFRLFIVPIFVIMLGIGNYSRLTGIENIRAIHIVTLLTIGMGIGVLLRNIFTYFRHFRYGAVWKNRNAAGSQKHHFER